MNRIKHGSKKHACIAVFIHNTKKKLNLNTKKDIFDLQSRNNNNNRNFLLFNNNNNNKKNLFTLTIN